MKREEINLLLMIIGAEYTNEKITFHNDLQQIGSFKQKYGKAFDAIKKKGYVDGEICERSELTLTARGKGVLSEYLKSKDIEKRDRKRFVRDVSIAIISIILTALVSWLLCSK